MKNKSILLRILGTPFILGLMLVAGNYHIIRKLTLFLRYGGEWITYERANERKTIQDIYELLEKQNKK